MQLRIDARDAAGVKMHIDQLTVSLGTVRTLINEQFPEWRSLPVSSITHDEWMETCFRNSEGLRDVSPLRQLWSRMRNLPPNARDVMTHADLIPGNVLVSAGRLAGILDVGGFGPADPALDLVSAWHLLEAGPRQVLREELRCDDLDWERGKAWAFEQAMGVASCYTESNPTMSRMGHRTLERILAG